MSDDQAFLVNYSGKKPLRFKVAPSHAPVTFTLSPHGDWAVVTIQPAEKAEKTKKKPAAPTSDSIAGNGATEKQPSLPDLPPKPRRDIFSSANIEALLHVLRNELARRDAQETTPTRR